jgi:prepilin-type N-terminal cleavage/methylation domain-containing protein
MNGIPVAKAGTRRTGMFCARRGLTLLEVLVVIVVVLMLLGLIVLAINNTRRAARMTTCGNYMVQLALALTNYEDQHREFPGFANDRKGKLTTFVLDAMPGLERKDVWDRWHDESLSASESFFQGPNSRTPYIAALQCVESTPPDQENPWTSYVGNSGCANSINAPFPPLPEAYNPDHARNEGAMVDSVVKKDTPCNATLANAGDGTAYTAMLSESVNAGLWAYPWTAAERPAPQELFKRVNRVRTLNTFVWFDAANGNPAIPNPKTSSFNAGKDDAEKHVRAKNIKLHQTLPDWDDAANWAFARPSSPHIGGAFIAFCDSRIVFIAEDIDYDVYRQLMTPQGNSASCRKCSANNNAPRPGPLLDGTY